MPRPPRHRANVRDELVKLEVDVAALEARLKALPTADPAKTPAEDYRQVRSDLFHVENENTSLENQYRQAQRDYEQLACPRPSSSWTANRSDGPGPVRRDKVDSSVPSHVSVVVRELLGFSEGGANEWTFGDRGGSSRAQPAGADPVRSRRRQKGRSGHRASAA